MKDNSPHLNSPHPLLMLPEAPRMIPFSHIVSPCPVCLPLAPLLSRRSRFKYASVLQPRPPLPSRRRCECICMRGRLVVLFVWCACVCLPCLPLPAAHMIVGLGSLAAVFYTSLRPHSQRAAAEDTQSLMRFRYCCLPRACLLCANEGAASQPPSKNLILHHVAHSHSVSP